MLFACALPAAAFAAMSEAVPRGVEEAVRSGAGAEAIVLFDDRGVESEMASLRVRRGIKEDSDDILALRQARYAALRAPVLAPLPAAGGAVLAEYSHLPVAFVRLDTPAALAQLAAAPGVRAIYQNGRKFPVLDSQSAALMNAPATAAAGLTGAGIGVVVIDTGADYTQSDLGSCSAPGVPAGCHLAVADAVAANGSIAADTLAPSSTANSHGTTVAAIIAGVAPGAPILQMNIFGTGSSAGDAQIIAAINWAIANRSAHNIRAINMSLGDGALNSAPCSTANPLLSPVTSARNAGIAVVAAAGNNGYTAGINNPACTPGAISVGAVYSGNFGGLNWSTCTDLTTAADQVTCFSNDASFLTLFAPGALITAGGQQYGGTSQATPFISGAAAVLKAAFPGDTPDQTAARMTGHGKSVTDARDPNNIISKPRLDLYGAAGLAAPVSGPYQEVPMLPPWAATALTVALLLILLGRGAGAGSRGSTQRVS